MKVTTPLAAQPDESLLHMTIGMDKVAATTLFRRYAHVVRKIAGKILGDPTEADQLVQEVFIFLFRKGSLLKDSEEKARSQILKVAYHRAFRQRSYRSLANLYGRRDLNQMLTDFQNQSESLFIDGCLQLREKESAAALWQLLSPSQMLTMELYFFEGYTFEEIAAQLDQKVGNIRKHCYRGIEKVRRGNLFSQTGIDASRSADWDSSHFPCLGSWHADDYFGELCALWSTGTLSCAEWLQLGVHLSHCSECQQAEVEYNRVFACLIPALASWLSGVNIEESPDFPWLDRAEANLLRNIS